MSRGCCCRDWSSPGEVASATIQKGRNNQIQEQDQFAEQDQDQKLRTVFRDIGNGDVHVDVDNVSVAVAVLLSLGLALGAIEPGALRTYIDQLMARE